jgi:hypothetical protein
MAVPLGPENVSGWADHSLLGAERQQAPGLGVSVASAPGGDTGWGPGLALGFARDLRLAVGTAVAGPPGVAQLGRSHGAGPGARCGLRPR